MSSQDLADLVSVSTHTQLHSNLIIIEIWRTAFTDQGILDFYLDSLEEHDGDSELWIDSALRLIANSCALSLPTKQLVFGRAPINKLTGRLLQKAKANLALLVLHSICKGFGVSICSRPQRPTDSS